MKFDPLGINRPMPSPPPAKQPNKALTNCPDCGHQVSKKAATCPACGAKLNFGLAIFSAVFWGIICAGLVSGIIIAVFQLANTSLK
jgi:hypothetical protein